MKFINTKCYVTTLSVNSLDTNNYTFDSDSVPIGIDTCTTSSLSGNKNDFVGKLEKIKNMRLKGVGGSMKISSQGTLRLRFIDDKGAKQMFDIKGSYYVPGLKLRLLSPQQWAKQGPVSNNGMLIRKEITSGDKTILKFETGTKTIPHSSKNGLPILYTKPGYRNYASYIVKNQDLFAFPTTTNQHPNFGKELINLDLREGESDEIKYQLPILNENDKQNLLFSLYSSWQIVQQSFLYRQIVQQSFLYSIVGFDL